MIGERTEAILEASVQDFIRTGEPITSSGLFERYDFGIKPAMIRWELHNLAHEGYFYQNHPSGGRIPSDKAYRFLVRKLMQEKNERTQSTRQNGPSTALFENERKRFVDNMADTLDVLGICYEADSDTVYRSGIRDLLDSVGQFTREDVLEITEDVEQVPERIHKRRKWWEAADEWPQIFIGENPLTRNSHLSVMIGKVTGQEQCLVIAIGAKRMNYEKALRWFRQLEYL